MAERAKREKQAKLSKLAELKRAREGGKRSYKFEEDADIYDEVTEEQYKSIVRGRLAKDDFVVDDGVQGYTDNGVDDFEERDKEPDSEEEEDRKTKAKKTKADTKAKAKARPKPPPAVTPSISAYRPAISAEKEEDMMSALLGEMDTMTPAPVKTKSRKRKPEPEPDYDDFQASPVPARSRGSAYSYRTREPDHDLSSDGAIEFGAPSGPSTDDETFMSPKKKVRTDAPGLRPAIESMEKMEVQSSGPDDFSDLDMDAIMDVDDDEDLKPMPSKTKIEIDEKKKPLKTLNGTKSTDEKKLDGVPTWLSVYDSLTVASDDNLGPLAGGSAKPTTSSNLSVLEEDGSLRFFWLDYLEHDGKLYFIGKTQDKQSSTWVSCCVVVENLKRNLFVLPREKRVDQDDDTGETYETDVVPTLPDVYADFDRVRKKAGINSFKAKFVKRKYAFGETDVPRGEAQWLKVVYGFEEPQIPSNVSSPNFSRVFGTSTSAFELLVLKRKIMGPCWLQIKHPQVEHKGVSWCKIEATVSDPKDLNPFPDTDPTAPKEIPPLTVASLSLRTIVNHQANNREIVCATARIWSNIQIEDPTPPETLPCSVHTFVRPLDRFPPNFETRARANGKGFITPMKNERMLLNNLLITLHKADPDVIVGHEFLGVSLDVLLHRMRDLKADHWSRIGRFRRAKWPSIGRQGTNLRFLNGRLLCDLASDGAKGMIQSTTWSLTEMCKSVLKSDRQEIDPDDTASYFDGSVSTPDRLLTFVRHCELDAHYQMALAAKVQLLPLTRQLTNLAGNSWNKTLNGGRAERNEYILLHEFHRLKYICPDKAWGKKAEAAVKADAHDEDGEGAKTTTKGKKDKYKGGLVFEPKRGLWDKFILVMDFNSLYPSIIQEYNIDFTTVERVEDEDGEEKIPEPPDSGIDQGVLPRLIATLVNRRRQVKSLMKDRKATQAQLLQWDIKQMALKLTANSMYGCLGFEYSRFYARPLAALTTFKGREILTHTRELAESLQLDVVYGDTDSVFVNSNVTDLAEALKISAEFKKAVNDRYKLLEIDLDGVFQRLLLLQKKKYAAIKVEEGSRTSTEVKGLDMKRREYCALSKSVSQYILEQILSGEATENVVENIHEYLTNIGADVRAGKVKLDEFIIFKRLGKNPEDYPDAKSQPHVQVALRMKTRGGTARSGDVIPYIFCVGESGETSKTAQADRAKHPDEVRKVGSELKIDYEHYLSQQILPPIERLCEPIEGTDRARLAECLGLDPNRYRITTATESEGRQFGTLDSLMADSERFKDVDELIIRCRHCQGEVAFAPIGDREGSLLQPSGPTCPACQKPLPTPSLQVQLESQIREHISKYYEHWTVCNDQTCGNRTRSMGVYGRRCLRQGCRGTVTFEYTDAMLYTQLRYYSYLFDGKRAASSTTRKDETLALVNVQAAFLRTMTVTVEKYLDQCGRRWVELGSLFSFMKL
ncbi:DNA-directed DNA polymerase alpha catalytic subunit pol1 [Steccherinum ochraceum]|uniref:DNA polymerase n=1 Tax=Steccherinum ochraceum TaxID=92696 RepID=A0A4V6N790_9APHY|nr:DNA-directed DNA polymerase alpha catalytic subunit pol1 [Steccherinum ochraceum]